MVTIQEIGFVRMYVSIRLDNGELYWLHKNDFPMCGFEEGSEYETDAFMEKIRICQYPRALNHAVSMLARRPYSKKEIVTRLLHLRYTDEVTGLVIYKLEKENLIDDQSFCDQWIRFRLEKRFGPSVIHRELRAKGIPENVIQESFNALDSETELKNAFSLAEKAWKRIDSGNNIYSNRQKVRSFLVRKGYDWDTACAACKAAEDSIK